MLYQDSDEGDKVVRCSTKAHKPHPWSLFHANDMMSSHLYYPVCSPY